MFSSLLAFFGVEILGFSDRDPRFDNTAHMLTSPNVAVDPVSTDFDGIDTITRIRQSGVARHAQDLPSGLAEQTQASSCSEPPCVWTCPASMICAGAAVGGFSVLCGQNSAGQYDLTGPCPAGGAYSKQSADPGSAAFKGLGCYTTCMSMSGGEPAGTEKCGADADNFCRDPDKTFPTADQCKSVTCSFAADFNVTNFTNRLHNDGPYCCFTNSKATNDNETDEPCNHGYTHTSTPPGTDDAQINEKCCQEYTGGSCYP